MSKSLKNKQSPIELLAQKQTFQTSSSSELRQPEESISQSSMAVKYKKQQQAVASDDSKQTWQKESNFSGIEPPSYAWQCKKEIAQFGMMKHFSNTQQMMDNGILGSLPVEPKVLEMDKRNALTEKFQVTQSIIRVANSFPQIEQEENELS